MKRFLCMLLAAALLLSCAACGGAKAASMWLVKTEGTVTVSDEKDAAVALTDRLGLFSGYGVATQAASYGWIDLDETKLTKMDENSNVEVQKDGKNLVLTVNRGSLFFNVTKPLAEDETLEIRSSNMVTAIRGTCGWVEVPDPGHMNVYILEGTVACSAGGVTDSVAVSAGQRAALSAAEGTVTLEPFSAGEIPVFVSAETGTDQALTAAVQALPEPEPTPMPGEALALEQYRAVLAQADSYQYALYAGGTPTGTYRYALVPMSESIPVPALLLAQENTDGMDYVRFFQYDPAAGVMHAPEGPLSQGAGQTGGDQGGLSAWQGGPGLVSHWDSVNSGAVQIYVTTIEGDELITNVLWGGSVGEDSGITFLALDWHDWGDLSALESGTPGADQ